MRLARFSTDQYPLSRSSKEGMQLIRKAYLSTAICLVLEGDPLTALTLLPRA